MNLNLQQKCEHYLHRWTECRYDQILIPQHQRPENWNNMNWLVSPIGMGSNGANVANAHTLTQQEPQPPWSRISWIVGQLGHCSRASNVTGMAERSTSTFFTGSVGLYPRGTPRSFFSCSMVVPGLKFWPAFIAKSHIRIREYNDILKVSQKHKNLYLPGSLLTIDVVNHFLSQCSWSSWTAKGSSDANA